MKIHNICFIAVLYCILTLQVGAQPPDRREHSQQRPHGRKEAVERYFRRLEEKNPEEEQRLRQLRRTDPEAFRREMRSRLQEKRGNRMEGLQQDTSIRDRINELREASSEQEQLEAKARLREAVAKRYDQSLAAREQALQNLREKLAELEIKHQRESERREAIIDRQVERLLREDGAQDQPQP